jgi:hypothetical protein
LQETKTVKYGQTSIKNSYHYVVLLVHLNEYISGIDAGNNVYIDIYFITYVKVCKLYFSTIKISFIFSLCQGPPPHNFNLSICTSDTKCFGRRQCENEQSSADCLPHVGYDPFGTCTCSAKKKNVSESYGTGKRYRRQVNEAITTTLERCHKFKTAKGGSRKRCDTTRAIKKSGYAREPSINEFDPALERFDQISDEFLG